jgi:hypothetical protein
MYAGVGADPLIFLPGSGPTRPPPVIKEPPTRPPPVIKEVAPEATPKTLPTVVPLTEAPMEEKSNLPLYIAIGGIAAIGIGFLLFRK